MHTQKPIVLVTGGSGLVGQAIKKIVYETNAYSHLQFCFASSRSADLTDPIKTNQLFENLKPTYVIHLAARVGGLYKNMNEPVQMFQDNLDINSNVIKACSKHLVAHSVYCLSTCIFPDNIPYPINEDMLHMGPPHPSNEGYAYAKRMLEVQTRLYNGVQSSTEWIMKGGLKGGLMTCVIPTNVYGEHDNFNLEDSHVIPGLIHKAYVASTQNEKFIVKGSGEPLRQFIYAEDLARLILYVLLKYKNRGKPLILSTPEESEISIKDVATIIAKNFGIDAIEFDTSFSNGQYRKTASNQRLELALNATDTPFTFTPIEEGIGKTIKWFKHNYNTARK